MTNSQIDLEQWDDFALVKRAIARGASDDRPYTILFNRYKQLVWRVCYRFTGSEADSEDLLQEVFIKAYRSLRTFQGRSTFRTWLYQITLNTCRNELRYHQRRPQSIDAHVDDLELVDMESSRQESMSHEFIDVATALMRLRQEEREILIMCDIEGQSYAEIASKLGVQLSAAKMRIQRARLALRSELHAQAPAEGNQ